MERILSKSGTTTSDLYQLAKELDLEVSIDWGYNIDPKKPRQILNLGNGILGGTHWVAVDHEHKRYFDSFGLPPPDYISADYEWTPLQIQDMNFGHCGQYAMLFLMYSRMNELDQLYNLFKIIQS